MKGFLISPPDRFNSTENQHLNHVVCISIHDLLCFATYGCCYPCFFLDFSMEKIVNKICDAVQAEDSRKTREDPRFFH